MFWDFKHLWLRLLGLERLRVQDVRVFLTSWFPACACAANVAVKDILKKMQDSVKRSSKSDWGPLTTMGTTGRVVFLHVGYVDAVAAFRFRGSSCENRHQDDQVGVRLVIGPYRISMVGFLFFLDQKSPPPPNSWNMGESRGATGRRSTWKHEGRAQKGNDNVVTEAWLQAGETLTHSVR